MKKFPFTCMMFVLMVLMGNLVGCVQPVEEEDPDVSGEKAFERVMLLEQFTSERCVNCPTGVAQIEAFIGKHPNVIWLCHHAGYGDDRWTISESKTIARQLGVSGAPSFALDRELLTARDAYGVSSGYNLHPFYLEYLSELPSKMTTASIGITTTYAAGAVEIHIAGKLKEEAPQNMRLTVVVKESGLHGAQADNNTLMGSWTDYVHADVVRCFVSGVEGDSIVVNDLTYSADYQYELDTEWVAENCMVVAFLTDENGYNVVQAAQEPLVPGSKGGTDLAHGGVTPKPVPEGYPEGKYSVKDFLKTDTVVMKHVEKHYSVLPNGFYEWHVQAWTTDQHYGSGSNEHIPWMDLVFFTEGGVSELAQGEWPLRRARSLEEIEANTAWAGYCDVEAQRVIGSQLMLISRSVFESQQQILPGSNGTWLLAEGVVTISEAGMRIQATSATGKPLLIVL